MQAEIPMCRNMKREKLFATVTQSKLSLMYAFRDHRLEIISIGLSLSNKT